MTLLSHIYLAAQIVVLPGVLVAMYRWAPRIYPRLRDTVIATWMLSLPVYALFPVAPPRLAGLGMTDAVSETSAVALAGHSTLVLQPDRGRPEPALRVRDGDRHRARGGRRKRRWLQVLALAGDRSSRSRRSRPPTTTCSTSPPAWPSPRSATWSRCARVSLAAAQQLAVAT